MLPPLPMLSVTVMMLRDMVESVTLLKDDVCWGNGDGAALPPMTQGWALGGSLPVPSHPQHRGPPEPPHPLQAGRPLLPPPPVALQEAGCAALLRGAAEPAGERRPVLTGPGEGGQAGGGGTGRAGALPAHGVVVV